MVKLLLSLFILSLSFQSLQASKPDSVLVALDSTLAHREIYEQNKIDRIDSLKTILKLRGYKQGQAFYYTYYKQIFEEYSSFIYDSSCVYARKLLATAFILKDKDKICEARINISFSLLSAGFFKEAIDTLMKVKAKTISDSLKSRFYSLCARAYYDLSDYYQDAYYAAMYNINGERYIDSAIAVTPHNRWEYHSLVGLKNLRNGLVNMAKEHYEYLIKAKDLPIRQYAIEASCLSYICTVLHQQQRATSLIISAAICDLQNSIKETTALKNLSDLLVKQSRIDIAYKYITEAVKDAEYYGARHRKVEIIKLLMNIQDYKLSSYEAKQRSRDAFLIFMYIATFCILIISGFLAVYYFNNKKENTTNLLSKNELTKRNNHLTEASKAMEENLGVLFGIASDYINKIDKLKKMLTRIAKTNKGIDLKDMNVDINPEIERDALFANFDKMFLSIYPSFVSVFNSFFAKEDQVLVDRKNYLPIEMRIYALIKLGVVDNQEIATILNYSVNTIYSYKTKIRNKSVLANDEFEDKILEIQPG